MRIEFIAQGLTNKSKTVGDYLCSSFRDKKYNSFLCFSAYTKMSGLKYIINDIESARDRYNSIKFYLGISEKGTSKEALELLIDKQIETWTFCTSSPMIFHPKIYLFEGLNTTRIIVGSSNLTRPGLFDNIEASTVVEFANTDSRGLQYKAEILSYFEKILDGTDPNIELLTSDLIEDFINAGFVVDESCTKDDSNSACRNSELFKKRKIQKVNPQDLGDIATNEFSRKSLKTQEYKITQEYLEAWNGIFDEFLIYKNKYNSVTIPRDFSDKKLLNWYLKQKIFYLNNTIPEDHFNKLISIGFNFDNINIAESSISWENRYSELYEFYKKNGYSSIKRIRDKENPLKSLSDWVAFQRTYFRQGKLSDYKIEKLNDIDFIWEIPITGGNRDDDSWFEKFMALEDFKKKHGHCNPSQLNKDGTLNSLGKWVNDQMSDRNHGKKNKRTGERVFITKIREELLEELGIDWQHELNKHKASFNEQIKRFLELREKYPDLKVPRGEFKKEKDWLSSMRHNFEELPSWKQKILIDLEIIKKITTA